MQSAPAPVTYLRSPYYDIIREVRHWSGPFKRVRVEQVDRHCVSKKTEFFLYFGIPGQLTGIDPTMWRWSAGIPFTMYSAKKGREMLGGFTSLQKPIQEKWRSEGGLSCVPKWTEVWKSTRSKKEAGFMWSLWHRAVATNSWRGRFLPNVDQSCPSCQLGCVETYTHCFFDCRNAKTVWNYCFYIIHVLQKGLHNVAPPKSFSFQQCLFGQHVRFRRNSITKIWSLVRGIGLWTIWRSRNCKVFEGVLWPIQQIKAFVWDSLLDYGRLAWKRTLAALKKCTNDGQIRATLLSFDSNWLARNILGTRTNLKVKWNLIPPGNLIPNWL